MGHQSTCFVLRSVDEEIELQQLVVVRRWNAESNVGQCQFTGGPRRTAPGLAGPRQHRWRGQERNARVDTLGWAVGRRGNVWRFSTTANRTLMPWPGPYRLWIPPSSYRARYSAVGLPRAETSTILRSSWSSANDSERAGRCPSDEVLGTRQWRVIPGKRRGTWNFGPGTSAANVNDNVRDGPLLPVVRQRSRRSRTPLKGRGNRSRHLLNPGRMFWLWWKTLSGSYVVFTSTSRS